MTRIMVRPDGGCKATRGERRPPAAEARFQEPEPLDIPDFQEIHLNPLTGQNEMADPASQMPEGQLDPDARANLPHDLLPPNWRETGRNSACPCGSGRKFKHCHGVLV